MAAYGEAGDKGLQQWLQIQGKDNINQLNELLDQASPWWSKYGNLEDIEIIDSL